MTELRNYTPPHSRNVAEDFSAAARELELELELDLDLDL